MRTNEGAFAPIAPSRVRPSVKEALHEEATMWLQPRGLRWTDRGNASEGSTTYEFHAPVAGGRGVSVVVWVWMWVRGACCGTVVK